ncbi:MAG: arginine--tRNA ligase [archaeon]
MDFREIVIGLISKETKLDNALIDSQLSKPPAGMGDFAFPCFAVAKEQKKNPVLIAGELAAKMKDNSLEKVEAKGPYINFFLKKSALSEEVLEKVFSGKIISHLDASKGQKKKPRVMVEYSSPNTNKPLHVGHLRNNCLGLAVANLLEATGNEVIKANLINDRGIHICKSMLAYKLYANGKTPESEKIKSDHFVGDMYVLFNTKLKEDPTLEEKAQELLVKWEKGDKDTIDLWTKMNKWALDGMKETYNEFGTKFDEWFFESKMFEKQSGQKIIEEGKKKNIFVAADNGAIVANLEPALPNKVLLRGDGTSLYATNDLGVTQEKFDSFKLDKSIWVVANEQDLYFKQLFAIFDKLERKWAKQCYHLSYGYVTLPTGRMKSREGNTADADDLIGEMEKLVSTELARRYPDLLGKEKEKRSRAIALAAIKFFLLKNDAKKDMVFDPEKSISFEGETGPYLQYTYARAKSILRKAGEEKIKSSADYNLLTHEKEKELIVELGAYADAVEKSWNELSLHPIAHNLLKIAEKFNSFYHEVSVLKAEDKKLVSARLALVEATSIVLKEGLAILDIEAIEEM